jgi:uncharacterized membrane protein YebE (DUF533 family)
MFDAKSLLGTLMQGGATPTAGRRAQHALQQPGLAQSLSGLMGGAGAGSGGLAGLAEGLLGKASQAVGGNRNLAVGGLGALAGALFSGRGGPMQGAVGGGALALLGTLALSALQNRTGGAGGDSIATSEDVPVGLREPAGPAEEAMQQSQALVLLQAMISAAKADGQIDGVEMQRILGKLDEEGADAEAKDFVLYQMKQPLDIDALVAQANSPAMAAQVYAASLFAIEVDTPAEQAYLDRLAAGLKLDPAARGDLHAKLGVPPPIPG